MEVASKNSIKHLPYDVRVKWIEAPFRLNDETKSETYINTEIVSKTNATCYSVTFEPLCATQGNRHYIGPLGWSYYSLALIVWEGTFKWLGSYEELLTPVLGHKYELIANAQDRTLEMTDLTDGRNKLVTNATMLYNKSDAFCIPSGASSSTIAPMRIFDFKMSIDGELVSDMIPVRVKGEGGMYDRVRDRVFLSAGSQKLIAGPELWEGEE